MHLGSRLYTEIHAVRAGGEFLSAAEQRVNQFPVFQPPAGGQPVIYLHLMTNKNSSCLQAGAINYLRQRMISLLLQFAFRRNTEFLPALCTAAGQYLAAIGSLHTLTETVNGFTAAAVWLKCSFHFSSF